MKKRTNPERWLWRWVRHLWGSPLHNAPIGMELPHDYFSPGTSVINGKTVCSLWAISFYRGEQFRYERTELGAPWLRVPNVEMSHEPERKP